MKRILTIILALSIVIELCSPYQSVFATTTDSSVTDSSATGSSSADSSAASSTIDFSSTDTSVASGNTVVTDGAEAGDNSTPVVAVTTGTSDDTGSAATTDSTASSEAAGDSTQPAVSESSGNESSDTNPIGDTSAYYSLDGLSNGPDISAESAILMDATTGAVLYTKESEAKRYPASITKVMTALLAIENCNMNDIITFSNTAVNGIEEGSSTAGINVGAKLTVEDTLYALMLVSANEAAAAVAEHVSGSTEEFGKLMTKRAKELGCTGTNFVNPHGLPDENHYTTAHDMALILKQALKYEEFRKISSTISYTLEKSDTLTDTLELWNHAKILRDNSEYYYKFAEGAKTGYTETALNTLVTYAKNGDVELLCVILKDYGADNSYYDTSALFKWGFDQVECVKPLENFDLDTAMSKDKSIKTKQLDTFKNLNCTFDQDYYVLVPKGFDTSTLTSSFVFDEDKNSGKIGSINISSGDTVIGTAPVSYDIFSESGQNYINGGSADDDLETAPVNTGKITPRKILAYMVRIIIAIAAVFLIMSFVRKYQYEQRRKERIKKRKKKKGSDPGKKI